MRRWISAACWYVALCLLVVGLAARAQQIQPLAPGTKAVSQLGTIAFDASAAAVNIGCTGTIATCQSNTYTATSSGNFLVFLATCSGAAGSVTSVADTGPGLTWTLRSSKVGTGSTGYQSVWYAKAPGAFSGKVTATYSACSSSNAVVAVFGVVNVAATPWDANGALPATSVGSSSVPTTGAMSTTLPDTLLLSFVHGASNVTAPAGWAHVPNAGNLNNGGGCCFDQAQIDFRIVTAAQSALTITYGTSESTWTSIGDALDSL